LSLLKDSTGGLIFLLGWFISAVGWAIVAYFVFLGLGAIF
jgi:hypothetical protein